MFPDKLDNADVLYYTFRDDFSVRKGADGEAPVRIHYFAICKYEDSPVFYLFECNGDLEVEFDYDCDSVDECKSLAGNLTNCEVGWIKK